MFMSLNIIESFSLMTDDLQCSVTGHFTYAQRMQFQALGRELWVVGDGLLVLSSKVAGDSAWGLAAWGHRA